MRIIQATKADVPRIMECAREFTSQIPDCPLDEAHYAHVWNTFLDAGAGVIFLLEDEGKVAGGIGGVCNPDLLTNYKISVELFWYVKEKYRSGLWPVRLLKQFEAWSKNQGARWVCMIHMECSMPEKLKRFYHSQGYELFETQYRKIL